MNILISANEKYVSQACIMLNSLFQSNINNDFNIYLFHSSLNADDIQDIRNICDKYNKKRVVKFIPCVVKDNYFKDAVINTHVTKEAYYRLLLSELIKDNNIKRILYLDVDLIVKESIDKLYNYNFKKETVFVGCIDKVSKDIELDRYTRLNIPRDKKYINSGVLLINVQNFRNIVRIRDILQYLSDNNSVIKHEDQDVINAMYYNYIEYVDVCKYNFIPTLFKKELDYKEKTDNAVIIHFAGAQFDKPWNIGYIGELSGLYYKYTKETPYEKNMKNVLVLNIFVKPLRKFWFFIKKQLIKILIKIGLR